MTQSARPLSPHLQIYKPQLTSVLSIFHRTTGVFSFVGAICILVWLVTLAWDASSYEFLRDVAASVPIQIFLFFWTQALIYHLFNGIRHMLWDAEKGFEIPEIYRSGKIVVTLAVVVNALLWVSKVL